MTSRLIDHAAVLEDLTFLATAGVGVSEAAARTGFGTAHNLDRYLRRHAQVPLLNRLTAQDPIPIGHPGLRKRSA